eukprot:1738205-Rhodomonas_salina.2
MFSAEQIEKRWDMIRCLVGMDTWLCVNRRSRPCVLPLALLSCVLVHHSRLSFAGMQSYCGVQTARRVRNLSPSDDKVYDPFKLMHQRRLIALPCQPACAIPSARSSHDPELPKEILH